ncbi:MAG: trypsin-like peptidase domain-containing protein [Pirellulales bacterium]|nr:trypsin-like peptidase domain-containing protein [Pirellulales bacterium]
MRFWPLLLLFATVAAAGEELVLYDFRSDRCRPCREMDPIVRDLQSQGYPIQVINVDQQPDLARGRRVGPIPCFIMTVNGQEVARQVGRATTAELTALYQQGVALQTRQQQARRLLVQQEHPPAASPPPVQSSADVQLQFTQPALGSENIAPRLTVLTSLSGGPQGDPWQEWRPRLMSASVRLTLHDAKGRAYGSGTVVDCREGEALVLTCGHVFREWTPESRVLVDFFGPGAEQQVPAKLLLYNLKSDVGILTVPVAQSVTVAKVAASKDAIRAGDAVLATGCEHGEDVAAFPTELRSIDKYLGPHNLQVAGQPAQGRSGGGLFNLRGELIGVCNAADKEDNEGLYAGVAAVHQLLDRARLGFVYRPDVPAPAPHQQLDRLALQTPPAMPAAMPLADREARFASNAAIPTNWQPTDDELPNSAAIAQNPLFPADFPARPLDPATVRSVPLAENQLPTGSEAPGAAEVIVIVRPHDSLEAQGQVIVLPHASREFLARLAAEKQSPGGLSTPPQNLANAGGFAANSAGRNMLPSAGGINRQASPPASMSWPQQR